LKVRVATWNIFSEVSSERSESEIVTCGLRYQALASQDGSEVVWGGIAIRIFFKSLRPESIRTRPECNLVKPWQWHRPQLFDELQWYKL
jgi:hypothetical protein